MTKRILALCIVLSCNLEPREAAVPLPFYNTADFTPKWILEEDESYSSIHKVAPFSFTNQLGESVNNSCVKGKIYVANFFFTSCPSICPKMTQNLKKLQEQFSVNDEVRLLSFSVMPEVDSIPVLSSFAELYGIDSRIWNLLTGKKEEIYKLAIKSYFADTNIGKPEGRSEFLHTENVLLIDKMGRIRGIYNGTLPIEVTRIIEDIKTLKELG
jgi:protein SCO1/2